MKALVLPATLLLTPLLGACAPTQTGGSLTPELMSSPLATVRIHPGETRYVQFSYSRNMVKVNDQYFNDLRIDFSNVSGQNVNSVEAHAGWLNLRASGLPRGVSVRLDRASVVKEVTHTDSTRLETSVNYYERVRVVLKVTASADAKPGDREMADLTYSDGHTESPVLLTVSVEN